MPAATGERLDDLLWAGAPGHAALVTAETGDMLSHERLREEVAVLAGRLASVGVGRGSRVGLVVPDGPDFLLLLLALVALGATAAPLNPAYKRDEYAFYLEDLEPELLVVPAGGGEAVREAAGDSVRTVEIGALPEREVPFEPAGADDVALLLHTSGAE